MKAGRTAETMKSQSTLLWVEIKFHWGIMEEFSILVVVSKTYWIYDSKGLLQKIKVGGGQGGVTRIPFAIPLCQHKAYAEEPRIEGRKLWPCKCCSCEDWCFVFRAHISCEAEVAGWALNQPSQSWFPKNRRHSTWVSTVALSLSEKSERTSQCVQRGTLTRLMRKLRKNSY